MVGKLSLYLAVFSMSGLGACATPMPAPNEDDTVQIAKDPGHCLRETGTLLKLAEGRCAMAPGRVYTRDQLEQTGQARTLEALDSLMPR